MHADVHRRKRQTRGRIWRDDNRDGDDGGELEMDRWHRCDGARNPNHMRAGIAGFDAKSLRAASAPVRVVIVMIVDGGSGRWRLVCVLVTMRCRAVLMLGMLVPVIRVHVR
jgi:hypothetical protein